MNLLLIVFIILVIRHYLLKYLQKLFPKFPSRSPIDADPIFPADFNFGVSTSAYQIEADIPPSNWSIWADKGHCPQDDTKCDGLKYFNSDMALVKELGCNVYRFSVCWSRLNPKPGEFDKDALMIYRNQCIHLKTLGIEPLITLWHFEHPAWLDEIGGVVAPEYVSRFTEFVEFVIPALSDVCSLYNTTNEPLGYILSSYIGNVHPPGQGSFKDVINAITCLLRCHVAAYNIIKRLCPSSRVSFAKNIVPFVPRHSWCVIEHLIAHFLNSYTRIGLQSIETGEFSFLFHKRKIPGLKGSQDFISINHYYIGYVSINWTEWSKTDNGSVPFLTYGEKFMPTSDFGWGLCSGSLYGVLKWVHQEFNPRKLPLMVTEHGIADSNDEKRRWFLRESLQYLSALISEGVPLTGYIHWSLLDNYEWIEGMEKKFGLYEVDPSTLERRKRPSADLYSKIIHNKRD